MSNRNVIISGNASTGNLMIKPSKVYIATDGVYANAKYVGLTKEDITISLPREYAEFLQSGALAYNIIVKSGMMLKFSFSEVGNVDQMALAFGLDTIDTTTVGHEKLLIDSNLSVIPDNLYIIRGEFANGREFEAVIWKGQVKNPEDLAVGAPTGATDFGAVGIEVEAILDDSHSGENLGYLDWRTA